MGGFVRPNNLKKCMKLNWNFQRGGQELDFFLELHSVDLITSDPYFTHNKAFESLLNCFLLYLCDSL